MTPRPELRTATCPPRLAEALLGLSIKDRNARDGLLGDLQEEYTRLLNRRGSVRLPRFIWYGLAVLGLTGRFLLARLPGLGGLGSGRPAPDDGKQRTRFIDELRQDVRGAFRVLRNNPGFTAAALLCLGLGIGANAAMFTVVNEALLRPLSMPAEARERAVALWDVGNEGRWYMFSYPNFSDLRDRTETLELVGRKIVFDLHATTETGPRSISGEIVSAGYFEMLGLEPVLGRGFLPEEDQTLGTHPVTVIGHDMWRSDFGSDPEVLGKTLKLNGHPFTIVGVAPEGYRGTRVLNPVELYVPVAMHEQVTPREARSSSDRLTNRERRWIFPIGQLKPGVSLAEAQAEMDTLALQITETHYPPEAPPLKVAVVPDLRHIPGQRVVLNQFATFMMAITGLVALIACANVANMLLARAAGRRKEIAVRLSIGCSRARLVRQLLTESLVLATLGGAIGLAFGYLSADLLLANLPFAPNTLYDYQLPETRGLDVRVLGFTLGVTLLTGLIFGLVPALRSSKPDLHSSLKEVSVAGRRLKFRVRTLLVTAQVAISVMLLIGAGLFIRSLDQLVPDELGFDPDRLLLAQIDLDLQGYDAVRGELFYEQFLERLGALPGVESASLGLGTPLWGRGRRPVALGPGEATPPQYAEGSPGVPINFVGADYLRTAGIPLIAGREFTAADEAADASVVVVNETMARQLWPGESPIGKRLTVVHPPRLNLPLRDAEVVGVAGDVKFGIFLEQPPWLSEGFGGRPPFLYVPMYFMPGAMVEMRAIVHIRTSFEPRAILGAIENELAALDPDLPILRALTAAEDIAGEVEPQRMAMSFTLAFAFLAAFLAAVGVYSVMASAVFARTKEIGVRVALGADSHHVVGLVLRQWLVATGAGVALGIAAALALSRVVANYVYGISATDPLSFLGAAVFLALVALAAAYLPSRRATRVDPLIALRSE